jgi:hypothetical protein
VSGFPAGLDALPWRRLLDTRVKQQQRLVHGHVVMQQQQHGGASQPMRMAAYRLR